MRDSTSTDTGPDDYIRGCLWAILHSAAYIPREQTAALPTDDALEAGDGD